jgi:2-succinyl-5-enolpyruvyl-6-hydroxy-3-cyclohexene-1-carboxylate synthase
MLNTQSPIAALDQVTRRRGAALLLDVLRSEGVRYVFGNPGTTELPLMDALIEAPDISYIWGLQEASVVAMADGSRRRRAGPALSIFTPPAGSAMALAACSMPAYPERRWSSPPANRIRGTPSLTLFCLGTSSG